MRSFYTRGLCVVGTTLLLAASAVVPAFATNKAWTPTGNSSNSFATGGNWTGGATPGGGDTAFITNNSATANQTNISALVQTSGSDYTMFGGAGVGVVVSNSNASGSGINKFLVGAVSGNSTFETQNATIGNNGIIEVDSGATFITYGTSGNVGTRLNSGGTLSLVGGTYVNGSGDLVVNANGTIVVTSNGTLAMDNSSNKGNGNGALHLLTGANLIVNSGTFQLNTGNANNFGGLQVDSGATITINSGAGFVFIKNDGADKWGSTPLPTNFGTIFMNGGSIMSGTAFGNVANDGTLVLGNGNPSSGVIIGSGTIAINIQESSSSAIIASNGVLNIFASPFGSTETITTVSGGGFGTNRAVSSGTLKINNAVASTMGGTWMVDSGGTLEVAANADLGNTVMGNNLKGTVKVDSGANLTLSTSAGSQSGTFAFSPGSSASANIFVPNTGGLVAFTNAGTFLLTNAATGSATFQSGFAGGNSYGFINSGNIIASSGGSLIINSGDATTSGFSNTASGTIIITNGSLLRVTRSATGWGGDTAVNMGTMILSNGTFQTGTAGALDQSQVFKNAGTIVIQGQANVTNLWQNTLLNAGSLFITNNNAVLQIGTATTVNWITNSATGVIVLGTNGTSGSLVATNGASGNQFSNLGTIQGQGTMTLGQNKATGGQNANFVNLGTLIATNWGGAAAGTFFISTGNANANGGFSNTVNGSILIASNATLTINRSQNAWASSANSVANLGTITLVGGSLNLASDGVVSNAASFINSGTISGWGTIDSVVITTNGGKVFANATNLVSSVGTLTLRTASTTNNSSATLGVIGTNSVLNLLAPGGQNVLINFGTISLSGGSINFGGGTGTITNFFVVAGVGNLASFGIVNTGALASVVAQAPISGLSNLIASVGVTNSAILGANNLVGGAATLTLGTSTGGGLVNNGTLAIQGGFVTVTNAAGQGAGVTNLTGQIYGYGTQQLQVANMVGGSIVASNGILDLGLQGNLNQGLISNFNASSTVLLTNTILRNTGTIALNGGGFRMGGSVVTNQGSITGPGDFAPALYNDTAGVVLATNGTLNVSTNTPLAGENIQNFGTFSIANGSTLNVVPAWLNTNGTVVIGNAGGGGNLIGGTVTNQGLIVGNGLITNATAVVNLSGGTIKASNGVLRIDSTTFTQNNGTLIGGTTSSSYLQMTNTSGPFVNNGTMVLDGSGNLSFYVLQNFTNAASGVVRGAGILRSADNVVGGAGANFNQVNFGNILATNGTLIVDSGDGFGTGFNNAAGATVTVANASTFGIARSTNAWVNATTNPVNNGVMILNGGTVQAFTNTSTGTTATPVALGANVASMGTISNAVGGTISGSGTIVTRVVNLGTIVATNGTLSLANTASLTMTGTYQVQNSATLDVRANSGTLLNNGSIRLFGGTLYATGGIGQVRNSSSGVISGFGQLMTSTNNGTAGGNEFVNSGGTIIATNGTLYFNAGNAFAAGGLSNSATAEIRVANGATFTLNRTVNAWNTSGANPANLGSINLFGGTFALASDGTNDSSRYIVNDGNSGRIFGAGTFFGSVSNSAFITATNGTLTIDSGSRFAQNGTLTVTASGTLALTNSTGASALSFTNGGSILMQGGNLFAGVITSTNTIQGYGTIAGGGVANSGTLLANATNLTTAGTLTVSLTSFTNNSGATLGVIGTNTVLDIQTPGNAPYLINLGTINLSGGRITNSVAGTGFTITNLFVIAGVGDLNSLPVVNAGANASIIAQNPTQGLSNLLAAVSTTNSAILGANAVGGAATLTLTVGNGAQGLVNNGTVALQGGFVTINGGAGDITNNTGQIYGFGQQNLNVVNLTGGKIVASNGTLRVGLEGNLNQGVLSNFSAGSTILLTNTILRNTGTIALNGGGLVMGGSVITNQGTITGPGSESSSIYNDAAGTIVATNGTLAIATNGATEFVSNLGTFSIASASTLNVVPDWNNTNGLVSMAGGSLTGGTVTNKGTIAGNGTITSSAFVNTTSGTVTVSSGGTLNILSATAALNGTMIAGTSQSIVMTNLTSLVNNGTMILNGAVSDANSSFLILRGSGAGDFTNAAGAVIRGAGYFATGVSGGTSFTDYNLGSILATNGALILQPFHAFGNGGFVNLGGGTVTVASASTFGIQRNDDAWASSGTVPINAGLIQVNGGSVTFYGDGLNIANDRGWSNASSGIISGFGTLMSSVNNLGTVAATNGNLNINNTSAVTQNGTITIAANATLTVLGAAGSFQNNAGAQMLLSGGTFVGTNFAVFKNQGTISGFGTIQTGRNTGSLGANQNMVNFGGGTIVATNGTLFLNPGDAFSDGGFSNSAAGAIIIANNGTLAVNRTANAWNSYGISGAVTNSNPKNRGTIDLQGGSFVLYAEGAADAARFIDNIDGTISGFGTISGSISNLSAGTIRATGGTLALQGTGKFLQAGTLQVDGGATMLISNVNGLASISNAGTILMNGGTLLAGAITNANWIYGSGSITGAVTTGVINLSNSFLFASNGVLSAGLGSFTNGIGVTMGTLSTNATLDVQMPGGASQPLINQGTLSFAGGTLLANGTGSGIITNLGGVILGVGNVTQTVANNGTVLAANPVSGLNIFSVGLSDLNAATLGASNGAILNVVLSGGSGSSFNNNGSISMIGGTLIISNGTPGVITNNLFVSGVGTVTPNIVNNGTIQATVNGGLLDFSLLGGTNITTGYIGAGLGATAQVENASLVNLGTIGAVGASGGTIQLASGVGIITNRALITGKGNLAVNNYIYNDSVGRLTATNGTLTVNSINGLGNIGTIDVQNSGTFQSNSSNSWSNAGYIDLRGGTLRTGGFTNAAVVASFTNGSSGVIDGYGTLIGGGAYGQIGAGFDKSIINLGLIIATNPLSSTAQTLYISTGGATSGGGIQNLGTMIVSSNNTLALDRGGLPVVNTGTITINNGTLSSTSTITNALNGIIQGYGTLTASIINQSGGTIRATNGLLTMTSTVFPINQGTLEIDNSSTMTWDTTNSWINSGTVDLRGGTLRTGGPTNALAGGEPFTNLNYMVGFGTIIGGGAFNTNGPGFDKAILNLGTIVASGGINGGTLIIDTGVSTLSNGIANFGTMIVATTNDTLVLRRQAETGAVTNNNFIINTGTILINGGTLTANTAITNQFLGASLPGLIQGFGTIALTNQLVNLGTIRSTTNIVPGAALRFVNPVGSALQINQSGTLVVEDGSQMIFGSGANAPLLNSGTIVMNGGTLASGMLTNSFGARFAGFGTITSSIINSGTGLATSLSSSLHLTGATVFNQTNGVLGANNGRLLVDAVFTNAGTVSFINSVGTFTSAVVNRGAWVMDPSTNVFMADYTVATNGYLSMTSGDVSIFKGNFVNVSTLSNQYNTLNGKFVMEGQGTQQFYVAGLNLGGFAGSQQPSNEIFFTTGSGTFSTNSFVLGKDDSIFGYSNNFALGTFELSGLSTTVVMDSFGTVGSNDSLVAGLYLNTLTLDPGSLLIISNNVELYFQTTNGVTGVGLGTLGAGDNVLILDGGSFHQLTVVPEPSILMLLSVGAFAIVGYRRRKARLQSKS